MSEQKDPIKDFKDGIVAKAAEALVAEMPPEKMRAFVEKVLQDALSEISSNQYSSVGRVVREQIEVAMKKYLALPETQQLIAETTKAGVDAALGTLSNEVKGKFIDIAIGGMTKALQNSDRRY